MAGTRMKNLNNIVSYTSYETYTGEAEGDEPEKARIFHRLLLSFNIYSVVPC